MGPSTQRPSHTTLGHAQGLPIWPPIDNSRQKQMVYEPQAEHTQRIGHALEATPRLKQALSSKKDGNSDRFGLATRDVRIEPKANAISQGRRVHVWNLSAEVTRSDMRALFSGFDMYESFNHILKYGC